MAGCVGISIVASGAAADGDMISGLKAEEKAKKEKKKQKTEKGR